MKKTVVWIFSMLALVLLTNCSNYTPEQKQYIKSIEDRREIMDDWMKNDPNSPFNYKGKIDFHGLNYFDVDPSFVFKNKMVFYDDKKEIPVFGTQGEERSALRIGYIPFIKDGKDYKVNVYANMGKDSVIYYSIWFTDKTTDKETYGVGRYLEFQFDPNPDHVYTIDFNLAFNPYCAYSPNYSCAIPTQDDYIDLKITAGEKKYHN